MKKIIVKILIIGFCIIAPHNVFALSNDTIDFFSLPEENSKLELVLSENAEVLKEEWIVNDTNTILTSDSIFQEGVSYTYHLQLLNNEDATNIIEKLKNQNWDTTTIEVIDDKYDFKGVYTVKSSQQAQEIKTDVNDNINNDDIKNGWVEKDGNIYYYENNNYLTGFQTIETDDGLNTYYFSINDGKMLTGFQTIGTEDGINTYYFSINGGKMLTGFQNIGTSDGIDTYYFEENTGKMLTGFQSIETEIGINTYYFSINSGKMLTGFQNIGTENGINTYYFSINSGKMLTGFQNIGTENGINTYYFSINGGKMLTGFQNIGTEDGIYTYYFSKSNGKMLTGFQNIGTEIRLYTYYFSVSSGKMLTGVQKIGNSRYVFYNDGRLMKGNAKVVVDISSWQEDIDFETLWKADVIDAVILRIAADAEREDPMFSQYIAEIKRLGIPYGIYIYSYAEDYNEGVIYANFMKSLIEKYDLNPTYGIYLDLESNGITQYMGPSEYEQVVRGFLSVLPTAKIYTYVNYANTALNSTYLRSLIDWIAHYHVYECAYTGSYRGWQFTDIASLPGIDGNVDLSIFNY